MMKWRLMSLFYLFFARQGADIFIRGKQTLVEYIWKHQNECGKRANTRRRDARLFGAKAFIIFA
jgi:hypothetical protein